MSSILIKLFAGNYAIFGFSTIFFFFAPYLAIKGLSDSATGWIIGAFYASSTLVKPVAGMLVEKIGVRRTLILAGFLGFGSGAFLVIIPPAFMGLFFLRLVMGMSFGIFLVALTAYQNLMIPDSRRGASFAVTTIGSICPMFTLMPLCDMFMRTQNYMAYLLLPAIMGGICTILAFSLEKVSSSENNDLKEWGSYGNLFSQIPLLTLVLSVIFFAFGDASIIYISSLVFSLDLIPSYFMVAFAAGSIFIRIAGRGYFNRTPRILILGPSLLCMGTALFLATWAGNNIYLAAVGFLYGLGVGYGFPALLSLGGDLVDVRLRPKMTSFILFFMDLSWFFLPLFMGYISSARDVVTAYRILALISITMAVFTHLLWIRFMRKDKG